MGSGPTRSMCTWAKRRLGMGMGMARRCTCLCILPRWHLAHSLVHCVTSLAIPGQTKREETSLRVARMPGWPMPCMESKTVRRKETGTKGLYVPVVVSQKRGAPSVGSVRTVRDGETRIAATAGHVCWAAAISA